MWAVVRGALLPGLLLLGGVASLIYGAWFRSVPVWEARESEETITIPADLPPGPMGGGSRWGGPPGFRGLPPGRPPLRKEVVKKTVLNMLVESEPVLMRDVSVGGIVLTEAGELKRTYTGKAPSLCPT
jgi:hypothetical protein